MKKLIQLAVLLVIAHGAIATDAKGGIPVMLRAVRSGEGYELRPVTPVTLSAKLVEGDAVGEHIMQCQVAPEVAGNIGADEIVTITASCPGGAKFQVTGVLFERASK